LGAVRRLTKWFCLYDDDKPNFEKREKKVGGFAEGAWAREVKSSDCMFPTAVEAGRSRG